MALGPAPPIVFANDLPNHIRGDAAPLFIAAAREGSREARGRLLDSYRDYLKRVARQGIGPDLQGKLAPSDLVQEALRNAQRDFAQLESSSHSRRQAWLTNLVKRNLLDVRRYYREAAKRRIRREVEIDSRSVAPLSLRREESTRKKEPRAASCKHKPERRLFDAASDCTFFDLPTAGASNDWPVSPSVTPSCITVDCQYSSAEASQERSPSVTAVIRPAAA